MAQSIDAFAPTQTVPTQQERTIDGCVTTSQLIHKLWQRANESLILGELEWFSNAIDRAEYELFNLKNAIDHMGCNVLSSGELQSPDSVSRLLFTLSNHLDAIHGLVNVGIEAAYLLNCKKEVQK